MLRCSVALPGRSSRVSGLRPSLARTLYDPEPNFMMLSSVSDCVTSQLAWSFPPRFTKSLQKLPQETTWIFKRFEKVERWKPQKNWAKLMLIGSQRIGWYNENSNHLIWIYLSSFLSFFLSPYLTIPFFHSLSIFLSSSISLISHYFFVIVIRFFFSLRPLRCVSLLL